MNRVGSALLSACLALPVAAVADHGMAAQPDGGRYVYIPPGAMVLVLPGPGVAALPGQAMPMAADFPVARMIAEQDSMIRRMMADMDSLMATLPDPQQMIRSVMNGVPQPMAGSGIVVTSISSGNGTCSETITYGSPNAGGQPRVKVTRTGNACGAITSTGPIGVTQTAPTPVTPRHERLWTVGDPPHPVNTGTPPRT